MPALAMCLAVVAWFATVASFSGVSPSISNLASQGPGYLLGVVVGQFFGTALAEEIEWRGLLLPVCFALVRRGPGDRLAMVKASLLALALFAASHIPVALLEGADGLVIVNATAFGALYSLAYLVTGSLWLGVIMHALHNLEVLLAGPLPTTGMATAVAGVVAILYVGHQRAGQRTP